MTAVVATLGSTGDVHPFLAVARAWREAGEDVLFLSAEPHRRIVEQEGLRFEPILSEHDHHRTLSHRDLWHPIRGFGVLWRHMAHRSVDATVEILTRECSQAKTQPVKVFASPLVLGARLAADVLPLELTTGHTAPSGLRSCQDPMFVGAWQVPGWWPLSTRRALWWAIDRWKLQPLALPTINCWRKQHQLPPIEEPVFDRWFNSATHIIGLFDPSFCPRTADWPPQTRVIGFPLFQATTEPSPSPDLLRFLNACRTAQRPPVLVYPGSAPTRAAAAMREASTLIAEHGQPVLWIESGAMPHTASLVHTEGLVCMATILPQCAGMLHHGGIGSTAQALAHGLPQWICPSAYDQFDNAARVSGMHSQQVRLPCEPTQIAEQLLAQIVANRGEPRHQPLRWSLSQAGRPNGAVQEIISHLQNKR